MLENGIQPKTRTLGAACAYRQEETNEQGSLSEGRSHSRDGVEIVPADTQLLQSARDT
jgi:hypothetical protein